MDKPRKRRLDFLPNRQNRYAIRRFSVGTASILVGATLIFGVHSNEASAATEDTATQESNTSKSDVLGEGTSLAETTSEAPAVEAAPTVETTDATLATEATPSVEKSAVTSAEEVAPQPEITEHELTAEEYYSRYWNSAYSSNSENQVLNEALPVQPADQTPTNKDDIAQQTPPQNENTQANNSPATQSQDPSSQSLSQADKLNEVHNYLTQNTTLSEEKINEKLAHLNIDVEHMSAEDIYLALLKDLANQQNELTPPATTISARNTAYTNDESLTRSANETTFFAVVDTTANNDVVAEKNRVIVADALANSYIRSQTDATNAAHTLSGRAWVVDHGTPATFANGLTPVPEGTKVYMQWIDKDGAVSPVYQANTTNRLSSADGSQVGPGAYAFDLREAWIDAKGTSHRYNATGGQYYRLWIDDFKTADGNTVTMLRQSGGFFPGSYVNSVTNSNLGQFPLIGTNMQRTGIFMSVIPTNGYTTKDNAQWLNDAQGSLSNPAVTASVDDFVSGKVWSETGAGDYANSATGPNFNNGDIAREGYQVVMSSLTQEGATAYKAQVSKLPQAEQVAAAHQLLTEHPEYISATVTGRTDTNGNYTLRFPKGDLNKDYLYGYVLDNQGNLVKGYSSFTSPLFQTPNNNLSFTPQTAPYYRPARNAWVNVNFALVETIETTLEITDFDITTNPAKRGDVAHIDVTSTAISPLPTFVEWRDSKGNVVQKSQQVTTVEAAEAAGTFTIPSDAKSGEIYTAYIVSGGNDIAADSLLVQVNENAITYQPHYIPVNVEPGKTATAPVPLDNSGQTLPSGTTFERGNNVPDWATVNPDGTISVTPGADVPVGQYNVPVVVTYPDSSKETVFATVNVEAPAKLAEQYEPTSATVNKAFGTPTTEQDVTGAVTIPYYPTDEEQPRITVDDSSTLPDGRTEGTVDVPVTVTYPDGTVDHMTVPVTTGKQADNDKYTPEASRLNPPYLTPTTEQDVIGAVTIPNYPTDGEQPRITVDDPSTLPDGHTKGTVDVPVTVTYPDGTVDHITVPVKTGKLADIYQPHYPGVFVEAGKTATAPVPLENSSQPLPAGTIFERGDNVPDWVTVNPDGTIFVAPGADIPVDAYEVLVNVTYSDGSKETVLGYAFVGEPVQLADQYEPTSTVVNKEYGTPTTEQDVTGAVTIPYYPTDEEQPQITVKDSNQLPDGTTLGTHNVPVVVTYPDGTTDELTVPVTVADTIAPEIPHVVDPVFLKDMFGTANPNVSGTAEPNSTVTINFRTGESYTGTADENGRFSIPVPFEVRDQWKIQDGLNYVISTDEAGNSTRNYFVVTDTIKPVVGTLNPITDKDLVITGGNAEPLTNVVIVNKDGDVLFQTETDANGNYSITLTTPINVGTELFAVFLDNTENFANGSYDAENNKIILDQANLVRQIVSDTTASSAPLVNPVTSEDTTVTGTSTPGETITVTFPNGETGTTTVNPDGTWTVDIPTGVDLNGGEVITATSTDESGNTSEPTNVTVTAVQRPDNVVYTPETSGVNHPYGTATTAEDVVGTVTVPNYPTTGDQPKVTVDDPSTLPNGNTEGTVDVPVTVTYPDGTVDHITVPVTTGKQADNDKYTPETSGVNHPYGTETTVDDITNTVTVPNYPTTG
ncbi:Rib/alpha-like domain-containing protein, partial [Staphylococcus lutrae]